MYPLVGMWGFSVKYSTGFSYSSLWLLGTALINHLGYLYRLRGYHGRESQEMRRGVVRCYVLDMM